MESFLTQHWKKAINPKYLGSHDLFIDDKKYKEVVTQITNIKQEEVIGDKNKKEVCVVAELKGLKPLILNRTNMKTITKLSGSFKPEKWIGLDIIIHVQIGVKAFGDVVDAIRIKNEKPNVTPRDYTKQIESINACADIPALVALWQSLDAGAKTACLAHKDSRKKQLEAWK